MKVWSTTLAVALMLTACSGDSPAPTAPSSSRSPAPSPAPAPSPNGDLTEWRVTQRFASVTGPDNCWVRAQRIRLTGASFPDLPMTVTRAGDSITLESSFFQVNYRGTTSGNDFAASGGRPLEGGGEPCEDGRSIQQMPG